MKQHTFQVGDRVILAHEWAGKEYPSVIRQVPTNDGTPTGQWVTLRRDDLMNDEWTCSLKYLTHDTNIQPGDWVRHESVNEHDEEYDGQIFQRSLHDSECQVIYLMKSGELFFSKNLVKIQSTTKETNMTPTPQEQWKAIYYPVPAKDMKGKSDLECLDHAIKKYRGYRSDVLEELGLGQAPVYWDSDACALCVNHLDKSAQESVEKCQTCPLVTHGKGSCLNRDSVWQKSVDTDNPQFMLDELVQVKKKVVVREQKEKVEPQFYVNGHGPYSELKITEQQPGESPWNIATINKKGITTRGFIGLETAFKRDGDHIKVVQE